MSYNINLTLENGVTVTYVKLLSVSIDLPAKRGEVTLEFYVTKNANDTGKHRVVTKSYPIDFTEMPGLNTFRNFIKTKLLEKPELSGITDA